MKQSEAARALVRPTIVCSTLAIASVCVTWPLVLDLESPLGFRIPTGANLGDAVSYIGYLAQADHAMRGDGSFWAVVLANPAFPAPPAHVFAGAMLTRVFDSPLLAHGLLVLGYVFLSFAGMFALARHLTRSDLAATFAALLYGSSTYLVHVLAVGHVNQVQLFLFPITFLAVERLLEQPSIGRAIALGGVLTFVLYSNAHYLAYLMPLIPLYTAVRLPGRLRERRALVAFGVVAGTLVLLGSYYAFLQLDSGTVVRSRGENRQYSLAGLGDLLRPDALEHIGVAPILLAFAALRLARPGPERRRAAGFAAVFVFSIVMALGPQSALHPYSWFYDHVPPYDLMRTPVRFMAPAAMACLALVAISVERLSAALGDRIRLRALVLGAIFVGSLAPLVTSSYYQRAPEPGSLWTFDLRQHPAYLRAIRPPPAADAEKSSFRLPTALDGPQIPDHVPRFGP